MRLTRRGIGLLGAGVTIVGVGIGFDYPEFTALGTACVLAVGYAVAVGQLRPQLTVTRLVEPDRVMRGESCTVTLGVGNAGRLGGVSVVAEDRCGPESVPVPLLRLRRGATTEVSYPVPTTRRGVVPLGPLHVGRRDPLGLARTERSYGEAAKVWVYPHLYPLAQVPTGTVASPDGLAERVPHGSITFDTLREYVAGDDLRRVHWRTTARIGTLMVREHVDTSQPRIVVLLDDRASAHHDDSFEHACDAAASVIAAALRQDVSVVLLTTGGTGVAAHAGSAEYLVALAEVQPRAVLDGDLGLRGITERVRHLRTGDTLVYLTGAIDPADLGVVVGLRGTCSEIVVTVFGTAPVDAAAMTGLHVLSVVDGDDFATAWDASWSR